MLRFTVAISKRFRDIEKRAISGLHRGLTIAGLIVENAAKSTTSFTDRTGNLRNSIASEKVNKSGNYIDVKARMSYAPAVEYGTKYMRGRHFMRDARDQNMNEIKHIIKREIIKEIKR